MDYKVTHDDTLLNFLMNTTSKKRNDLKNLLKYQCISVNNNTISQFDYPLRNGDVVSLTDKKSNQLLDIIYEDDEFIVINKPCGLLSERTTNENTKTAFHYVSQYLKQKREKVYLVHRLDQYTSGVLMFVKDKELYDLMTHNWNHLVFKRDYIAVVEGNMSKKEDTIDTYLYESKSQIMKVSQDKGQKAITHYRVLKSNSQYCLLDIQLKTGRKNQIRAHMSYLHHPVIGDNKYGHKSSPIHRLGLHAYSFGFYHPKTNKKYIFETEIPKDFLSLF